MSDIADLSPASTTLTEAWSFSAAIEATPAGMLMVDAKAAIVLVNAQLEKLSGYSRAELIGQPVQLLIPERFQVRHPEHIRDYVDSPLKHSREQQRPWWRDLHADTPATERVCADGGFATSS